MAVTSWNLHQDLWILEIIDYYRNQSWIYGVSWFNCENTVKSVFKDINSAINKCSKSNNGNIYSSYYSVRTRSSGKKVGITDETIHFQLVSYLHSNTNRLHANRWSQPCSCVRLA